MVVFIYIITTVGNSVSSQLGNSCQGNRYSVVKAGGTARPSHTKSHLMGDSPPCWTSSLVFGLIGSVQCLWGLKGLVVLEGERRKTKKKIKSKFIIESA
jgi:hypothetical protein